MERYIGFEGYIKTFLTIKLPKLKFSTWLLEVVDRVQVTDIGTQTTRMIARDPFWR